MSMLEEAYQKGSWADSVSSVRNPFGSGDSGERIVSHVTSLLKLDEAPLAKCKKVGR